MERAGGRMPEAGGGHSHARGAPLGWDVGPHHGTATLLMFPTPEIPFPTADIPALRDRECSCP